MSYLRKELGNNISGKPLIRDGTAYLLIYRAVKDSAGLIHGRLHDGRGAHCAIGNYFDRHDNTALPEKLIDEVAAVNDSMPAATPRARRLGMLRWLRWRLAVAGVAEFARFATKPSL
jgi:hypothetical protein